MERVLKIVRESVKKLNQSDYTFKAIFDVMFGFSDNIIAEKLVGTSISYTTYHECQELIEKTSAYYQMIFQHIPTESYIGLKLGNSLEWIVTFWSLLQSGYRPVLINTQLDSEMITNVLTKLAVKAVITDYPELGDNEYNAYKLIEEAKNFQSTGSAPKWSNSIVLSTSGTSGPAKICLYEGKAICMQILKSWSIVKQNKDIRSFHKGKMKLLAFLPFYHIYGLSAVLLWFGFFGRTFVFLKDNNPENITRTCQLHQVTHVFAVPILWNTVAQSITKQAARDNLSERLKKGLAISAKWQNTFPRLGRFLASKVLFKKVQKKVFGPSIKFCISGGGYVLEDTLKIVNAIGYSLHVGYGMTEIGITSVELASNYSQLIKGSIGQPLKGITYQIVNNELQVKGDSLFTAIFQNECFVLRREEEWFKTGDIAYQDSKGNYFINGRLDDIIIGENGENINPDDLERYFTLDYVKRFSILGVPNEDGNLEVTLVAQISKQVTNHQVRKLFQNINAINATMPIHQQVRRIIVTTDSIALEESLKVNRKKLISKILKNELHEVEFKTEEANNINYEDARITSIKKSLKETIAAVLTKQAEDIHDDDHFIMDLGGNSLEYFVLISRIEEAFNIKITFTNNTVLNTVNEFCLYIDKNE